MNIDDIIAIIFILIFFIGPLLKKIFDAVSAGGTQPNKMNSQQVQEYLKKMREYSDPDRPKGYQAPSSHSYTKANKWSQDRYVSNKPKEQIEKIYEKAYKKLTPNLQTTTKADTSEAYKRDKVEHGIYQNALKPYVEEKAEEMTGISKIFESQKYTQLQKAIILSEILKKPSF